MSRVSIKAILLGSVFGYVLPTILFDIFGRAFLWLDIKVLSSTFAMLAFVWFFLFAPLVTGYIAAKNATCLHVYHGLISVAISMTGLLFVNESPWIMTIIFVVLSLILGTVGARRYKLAAA